jgi:hypothetical protein
MSIQEQPPSLTVYQLVEKWKLAGDAAEEVPLELMPPWADICSRLPLRWRGAVSLVGRPFRRRDFGYPGVYRLYGLASRNGPGPDVVRGAPNPVNRICGIDYTATLYIGRGRRLSVRLNALRRALRDGYGSHHVPEMLRFYRRLHQDFPPNLLRVALYACRNCKRVESDLIDAYINSFGEMPPLNERLGSRWLSDDDE